MPGGDRTGPSGAGPMTGRAAGYCAGFPRPGHAQPAGGAGFGGRGPGRRARRGWRNRFFTTGLTAWQPAAAANPGPADPRQQLDALKGQADSLAEALEAICRRIDQLEADRSE